MQIAAKKKYDVSDKNYEVKECEIAFSCREACNRTSDCVSNFSILIKSLHSLFLSFLSLNRSILSLSIIYYNPYPISVLFPQCSLFDPIEFVILWQPLAPVSLQIFQLSTYAIRFPRQCSQCSFFPCRESRFILLLRPVTSYCSR